MHDQEYELDPNQRVRHEYDAYKAVNESSSHVIVCVLTVAIQIPLWRGSLQETDGPTAEFAVISLQ